MPPISCECALHRFHHRSPNWTLMIKVIFKFISALRPWVACTIFSAIILLHLRIHSSKNYSIFLYVFTLIFLITLPTITPRMKNQFIQLIRLFLRFTFDHSTYFSLIFYTLLVYFFYATPKIFYHEDGHSTYKRAAGRERPTTQKKARRP